MARIFLFLPLSGLQLLHQILHALRDCCHENTSMLINFAVSTCNFSSRYHIRYFDLKNHDDKGKKRIQRKRNMAYRMIDHKLVFKRIGTASQYDNGQGTNMNEVGIMGYRAPANSPVPQIPGSPRLVQGFTDRKPSRPRAAHPRNRTRRTSTKGAMSRGPKRLILGTDRC